MREWRSLDRPCIFRQVQYLTTFVRRTSYWSVVVAAAKWRYTRPTHAETPLLFEKSYAPCSLASHRISGPLNRVIVEETVKRYGILAVETMILAEWIAPNIEAEVRISPLGWNPLRTVFPPYSRRNRICIIQSYLYQFMMYVSFKRLLMHTFIQPTLKSPTTFYTVTNTVTKTYT